MQDHLPIIVVEVVMIFGGVLVLGWWQLRSLKRDREQSARERAQRDAASPPPTPEAR